MQGSPDASSPAWLAQAGDYVASTQQELGEARWVLVAVAFLSRAGASAAASSEHTLSAPALRPCIPPCRRQVDALQADKSALQLQLMVARQEQAGQVANLQADVASLQARLELAGSTVRSCEGALQAARQQLQEERAAAEQATASSRQEQAGLRERVRLLEARCAEQAQQLQALPGLQQQVQQQGQALQRSQQEQQATQKVGAGPGQGCARGRYKPAADARRHEGSLAWPICRRQHHERMLCSFPLPSPSCCSGTSRSCKF